MPKHLLVTGGAGFIGSAFIRYTLAHTSAHIVNLDLLTYAGNLANLKGVIDNPRHLFFKGDINDAALVETLCTQYPIDAVVHFAAESHVDRSITNPRAFLETNVAGTLTLLEVMRRHPHIHFHHISTDEVFGSITSGSFSESSPYQPNSPYAASKAAADHFVRAYAKTYGIPTTISHASNNYGPYQHSEKFIPCMIMNCLQGKPLPIYGDGKNVRDWLYVDDHAEAIWAILNHGKIGETYAIGGSTEMRNIDLAELILTLTGKKSKITFVADRPGHDFRYALDCSKMAQELKWIPRHPLSSGLAKTIEHYLGK